jgi:uncharacterized protein (DUF2147 family)
MKHHALAAMGLLTAALLVPGAPSHAASADPTGFWVKPGSERNAKIQVRKCGKGLCANIVWLENPNDSKGRPLRDIRNENPSQRGRSIVGLPLFSGLAPSAPGIWTGKIYNPEDGNTYSVTLTVVSRQQLKLKGCKGWVMCGERMWLRTSPPPAQPKPEETIEASVKPDAEKAEAPPVAEAKAESPAPTVQAPTAPAEAPAAGPATPMGLAEETEMVAGAAPVQAASEPMSSEQHARSGYRMLNASMTPETVTRYSGENVPSIFDMTKPVATGASAVPAVAAAPATQAALPTESSVPPPSPKPKPSVQASAAASKPAGEAKSVRQAAPAPQDAAEAEKAPARTNQQAAVDETTSPPLTRRQKRLLRRQQMGQQPLFPWLRSN